MTQHFRLTPHANLAAPSIIHGKLRHAFLLPAYFLAATAVLLVIFAIIERGNGQEVWLPMALGALLSGYLAWEIRREVILSGYSLIALVSPAVLASLVHFYLSYCTPVIGMMFDEKIIRLVTFWSHGWEVTGWISYAMMMMCVAAFAFWRGYRFIFCAPIAEKLKHAVHASGLARPAWNLNLPAIYILASASIGARLLQIYLGVFGYASNSEALYAQAAYRSYLDYGSELGLLGIFLISLEVLRPGKRRNLGLTLSLYVLLFLETAFGFLSGFKGAVIEPIIIVGAAYFVSRGRFPVRWAVAGMFLLVAAFAIIEPFRQLHVSNKGPNDESVTSIFNTLESAALKAYNNEDRRGGQDSAVAGFLARSELVSVTSTALHYRDTVPELGPDAPDFLGWIVFAPIYAFVPRLLWPEKPIADFGAWFDYRVIGRYKYGVSSTGMGPVSYFYFVGGIPAVVLGFFGLGMFYRVIFDALTPLGAGGWLMYFSMLSPLAVMYSEIGPNLAGMIQLFPLSLVIQAIVLRRPPAVTSRVIFQKDRATAPSG